MPSLPAPSINSPKTKKSVGSTEKPQDAAAATFSTHRLGRSVPCAWLLPSPGVIKRGHDIQQSTPDSSCENVGENTGRWRTSQGIGCFRTVFIIAMCHEPVNGFSSYELFLTFPPQICVTQAVFSKPGGRKRCFSLSSGLRLFMSLFCALPAAGSAPPGP